MESVLFLKEKLFIFYNGFRKLYTMKQLFVPERFDVVFVCDMSYKFVIKEESLL